MVAKAVRTWKANSACDHEHCQPCRNTPNRHLKTINDQIDSDERARKAAVRPYQPQADETEAPDLPTAFRGKIYQEENYVQCRAE
jgi:hypothetical protein